MDIAGDGFMGGVTTGGTRGSMQQFRRGSKEDAWEWRDTEADGDIGIPTVPGVRCLYPPHPALRDICQQDNGMGLYPPPLQQHLPTFTTYKTLMQCTGDIDIIKNQYAVEEMDTRCKYI